MFEIKYPGAESQDLHSYALPLVLTLIMTSDLENHWNVENTEN